MAMHELYGSNNLNDTKTIVFYDAFDKVFIRESYDGLDRKGNPQWSATAIN